MPMRGAATDGGSGTCRRPSACLIAISQTEAALRNTSLAPSRIAARSASPSRGPSAHPRERVSVEQQPHRRP